MYTYVFTFIYMYIYIQYICINICTHIHLYTYTYIYTHTYVYTSRDNFRIQCANILQQHVTHLNVSHLAHINESWHTYQHERFFGFELRSHMNMKDVFISEKAYVISTQVKRHFALICVLSYS